MKKGLPLPCCFLSLAGSLGKQGWRAPWILDSPWQLSYLALVSIASTSAGRRKTQSFILLAVSLSASLSLIPIPSSLIQKF